MKRYRRLRRLVPDGELVRRRAAGETLRRLAGDYGVAHTTLGRWFARPEVARQLKEAARCVRADRRAVAARRTGERRLEGEVRRQAREQAALERARRARAAAPLAARRVRRSAYEAWLDEHDARLPLTRADLYSRADQLAAGAVAAGGGIGAVIEATGLHTRANVLRLIDPTILVGAFGNEAAARAAAEPERERLRRLVPDRELVRRRAAGETLRGLAADYGVAHTTLGRWFARPEVARQLREAGRRLPALGAGHPESGGDARAGHEPLRTAAEEHTATMRRTHCPEHGRPQDVRVVQGKGEYLIEAFFCCGPAREARVASDPQRGGRDALQQPRTTRRR